MPTKRLSGEAWFDHRTDIPQWAKNGVAQIIIEWSVLERELEELIRLLMDTDIQHVRILTARMNARTRILAATHLIEAHIYENRLKGRLLTEVAKLGKTIEEVLQNKRDIVAHSLWGKYKGKWCVLKLKARRATPGLMPDLKHLSRAALPQREEMSRAKLYAITLEIVTGAKAVESFCERLKGELPQLRYIPPKYTRRRARYRSP